MDICLNISTATPVKQKKDDYDNRRLPKVPRTGNTFSFNFTDKAKVKATVIRKQPVKKQVIKIDGKLAKLDNNFIRKRVNFAKENKPELVRKQNKFGNKNTHLLNPEKGDKYEMGKQFESTKHAEGSFREIIDQNPSKPRRNFVLLNPRADSSEDEDYSMKSNDVLSLNITSKINDVILRDKKQKVGREERLKAKKKQRNKQIEHVLTQEEITEGIKKFSFPPKPKRIISTFQGSKKSDLFINNSEIKVIGQRLVKPITEKIFTGAPIDSLGLHPHSVKNLADILNITELTTVQQMAIPRALEGKDLLVRSQTGSGKTLAYALPVVEKLQEIRPKLTRNCGIQAVVIVPTRELAIQTYELFLKLLKPFTWIVPGIITGGERRKAEKARLRKGIVILIGTPGRLCDHLLHTESFKLDTTRFLILDEADRLLELGYERDVKKIVEAISEHKRGIFINSATNKNPFTADKYNHDVLEGDEVKSLVSTDNHNKNPFKKDTKPKPVLEVPFNDINLQRLLLSATLTTAVQKLAGLALKDPIFIDTSDSDNKNFANGQIGNYEAAVQEAVDDERLSIPATVELKYVLVPSKLRLVTLAGLLATESNNNKFKALVFMSTTEMVNFHHDLFNEILTKKIIDEDDEEVNDDEDTEDVLLPAIRFFKLHGSMTQNERSGIFKAFRNMKSGILLTTDVTGRGIDVPEVDLVVQYSPPQKVADFVHRVGRTARAGRNGRAVLFLGPTDTDFIRILEDKRIRISQSLMDTYLMSILEKDAKAHNIQEAASNLQHKFEELLKEDEVIHDSACKAFISWIRFYSTFPKELKSIFNTKSAHMGHYAKSFGLQEPPKSFAKNHTAPKPALPVNRLTYTERDPEKIKQDKTNSRKRNFNTNNANNATDGNRMNKFLSKSISLSTSEFGSGLEPLQKRKKN